MPENSPNNNNQPANASTLDSAFSGLLKLKDFVVNSIQKLGNLEQTNLQLGLQYMKQRAYIDAALRFKFVNLLNPNNEIAYYLQGKALVFAGKIEKAKAPLRRAIKARPELEEAHFFLSVCGVGAAPDRVPPSLLIEFLENSASQFVSLGSIEQNSEIYAIGSKAINDYFAENSSPDSETTKQGFSVLDLDIRDGLCGEFIAPIANHIVGVEPCLPLIAHARSRRVEERLVYNELVTKTALDFLKKDERKFDIIQAYSTCSYNGWLNELFEQFASHAQHKSLLLLCIDTHPHAHPNATTIFDPMSFQFLHAAEHIIELAKLNGFSLVSSKKIERLIEPERNLLNIFSKPKARNLIKTVILFKRD